MTDFEFIYLFYALVSLILFAIWRTVPMLMVVYFAGLVFLPVTDFPAIEPSDDIPIWIIGTGLPSDLLVTKGWIPAFVATCGLLLFARDRFQTFRPGIVDLPVIFWCLWPLLQSLMLASDPDGAIGNFYLFGVWGLPWLIGRCCLSDDTGRKSAIDVLIWIAMLLVPIALFEIVSPIRIYELLYGPHPFAADGVERYFGFRPLAFFEHGTQYGLWLACASIAAYWRSLIEPERQGYWAVAAILAVTTVASQSVGAILLLACAAVWFTWPWIRSMARRIALPSLVLAAVAGAVFTSGMVPVRAIVMETAAGQELLSTIRATGRGSITWRISQDEKTLPIIRENMPLGAGEWDWWRPAKTRPWGFPQLVAGQYGLPGFTLVLGIFALAIGARGRRAARPTTDIQCSRTPFKAIVGVAILDAFLNAFLFLPAIAMAGALVTPKDQRRSAVKDTATENPD